MTVRQNVGIKNMDIITHLSQNRRIRTGIEESELKQGRAWRGMPYLTFLYLALSLPVGLPRVSHEPLLTKLTI